MNKAMKISKVLNIIAGIGRVIFKIAAVMAAVAVVILLFVPKHNALWQNAAYTLQLGNLKLELIPDGMIPPEATRLLMLCVLALSVPLSIYGAKFLQIVQEILTPMSQGKPFDKRVSASLRKLSFVTLIGGGISEVGDVLFSALELNSIKLDALFNPAFVSGYTVEQTLDTNFLVVFGILFLMSHIFRYGEELQQLSDETL